MPTLDFAGYMLETENWLRSNVFFLLPGSERSCFNKVAVVTGAGRGIGKAYVEALARRGCNVALVDNNSDLLDRCLAELKAKFPKVKLASFVADVTSQDAIVKLQQDVYREFHVAAVHLLINNAGVCRWNLLEDQTVQDIEIVTSVNAKGPILVTRQFLPDMQRCRTSMLILNIASMAGKFGAPTVAAYSASKHAVVGFSESLIRELRLKKIRHLHCAYVCPLFVNTPMITDARFPQTKDPRQVDSPEHVAENSLRRALKGERDIFLPYVYSWINAMQHLLPRPIVQLMGDLVGNENDQALLPEGYKKSR